MNPNDEVEILLLKLKKDMRSATLEIWKNHRAILQEYNNTFETIIHKPVLSPSNKLLIQEMRLGLEDLEKALDRAITQFS